MGDKDAAKAKDKDKGGKDKPASTPSRLVDQDDSPQQIILKARESLIILSPEKVEEIRAADHAALKDMLETYLVEQIPVPDCPTLKNLVFDKDNSPTPNATHVWNVMNGFLLLTGQKDDTETWGKLDYAYGKLMEMSYKIKYGLRNEIPTRPAAGGALKLGDATKMFNESLKKGDETAVERLNVKLNRLHDKVAEQIVYLENLYTTGIPRFNADFEKRIEAEVSRLEKEVETLETEKSNFIKQVEDPTYKFKTLLDKFKTEAEFVSWIEKAKKEHIEAVSEARKTSQTLKSVSTLKKSIDKCIEDMKKSLNINCEKISKYNSLADESKKLESKYQLILSLSAFMVDPGRGISNIRDVLEKLGIASNGVKEYIEDNTSTYQATYDSAKNLIQRLLLGGVAATGIKHVTEESRKKIQELLDILIKFPLYEKIPLIEPEMTVLRQLSDSLKKEVFSIAPLTARDKLTNQYLKVIKRTNKEISKKLYIIISILDSASSAPAMDQIRKLRVQAESKLTEINDKYEEIKEEATSPIDVGKCLRDYKAGIAAIKAQNESEFEKIEKEEKESISKIAQDISKIREATKVNITANIQQQGVPQAPVKPYAQQNLKELLDSKEQLEKRMAARDIKESKKNEIKDKISQVDAFIKVKSTARGGSRMYAHSTRRKIR